MSDLPKDPMILLSYVNLKLRDYASSLEEFCNAEGVDREKLEAKLKEAGFTYDRETNQFK